MALRIPALQPEPTAGPVPCMDWIAVLALLHFGLQFRSVPGASRNPM